MLDGLQNMSGVPQGPPCKKCYSKSRSTAHRLTQSKWQLRLRAQPISRETWLNKLASKSTGGRSVVTWEADASLQSDPEYGPCIMAGKGVNQLLLEPPKL